VEFCCQDRHFKYSNNHEQAVSRNENETPTEYSRHDEPLDLNPLSSKYLNE
jgi:hypothetical protein